MSLLTQLKLLRSYWYTAVTVSDLVTRSYQIEKKVDYAATLPEEIGRSFHGKIIKNFNKINFSNYDKIFISSVGYERKIIQLVPEKFRHKLLCIHKSIKQNYIDYSLCKYESFLTIKDKFNNSK